MTLLGFLYVILICTFGNAKSTRESVFHNPLLRNFYLNYYIYYQPQNNYNTTTTFFLQPNFPEYKEDVCNTKGCQKAAEIISFNMDKDVDPCEDFYDFACGNYIKKTKIPSDLTFYDGFQDLNLKLQKAEREVMENIQDLEYKPFALVSNIYKSCMDEASINQKNGQPLLDILEKVLGGWPVLKGRNWNKNKFDVINKSAELRRLQGNYLIVLNAGANFLNNSEIIISIDQASLGFLRDFLVKEQYSSQRDAYQTMMIDVAELLNGKKLSTAQISELNEVLAFERELAAVTKPPEERRDLFKIYNKMTLKEAQNKIGKDLNLKSYITKVMKGVRPVKCSEKIILGGDIQYYHDFAALLQKTSKRTLANYLGWRFSQDLIPALSSKFLDVKQKFDDVVQGKADQQARWLVCVNMVNRMVPMAIGKLYVDANFNEESKQALSDIILQIRDTYYEMIEEVDWMDAKTKDTALLKLKSMGIKIGYPDYYSNRAELEKDYEGLTASPSDFFQNMINYMKFAILKDLKESGHPRDKTRWPAGPAAVNAYNAFAENNLYIQSGILHPPVFESDFPRQMNYGGIASIAGHEFTHGFDDIGKKFDAEGNLKDWWSKEAGAKFVEKSKCIVDQYHNFYMPEINLTINGVITQGENIADIGGLKEAYRAYKKIQKKLGDEPKLPGLEYNQDQIFFIGFATRWCQVTKPEALRLQVLADPHSPPKFRVNGPLLNLPEFLETFNCPKNSKMAANPVCKVW